MASLPTARAAYQPTSNVSLRSHRDPFACPSVRSILREVANEAEKATTATTQAAYLLRLHNVRRLLKSIG